MKAGRQGDGRLHRRVAQDPAAVRRRPGGRGAKAEAARLEQAYTPRGPGPPGGRRRRRTRPDGGAGSMTRTVIGSATREVVIGDDQPFVIIGERINPTGRKLLAEEMKAGDFSRVERDVLAQVEAGAHMLDVNAGIPLADEPAILARTIQLVQSPDRPAPVDRLVDRRGARGGPRRLPGQGPRQLGHRGGGAAGAGPAARPQVRRGGRGDLQRRDRHLRGSRRPVRGRQAHRGAGRSTTASRARTSSWIRCSCRSGRCRPPAGRCSGSSAGCATSCASTAPAAPRTSASACPTARASTAPSWPWPSPAA